jgi:hypothetical protein
VYAAKEYLKTSAGKKKQAIISFPKEVTHFCPPTLAN